jgi:hypothetical protein
VLLRHLNNVLKAIQVERNPLCFARNSMNLPTAPIRCLRACPPPLLERFLPRKHSLPPQACPASVNSRHAIHHRHLHCVEAGSLASLLVTAPIHFYPHRPTALNCTFHHPAHYPLSQSPTSTQINPSCKTDSPQMASPPPPPPSPSP